jgi:MFS family permease
VSSFAALRVPAYRRLLFGATTGELGLFAFETALFWTVLERTGSSVDVGLLFVGLVLPMVLLTIPVGLLTDRVGPRRPMVLGATAGTGVLAVAAVVAHLGVITFEVALVLSVLEGIFFALWAVPSQVLAGRVVDRRRITSAIGLSSVPRGIGAVLGGLTGGLILAAAGPAPAFIAAGLGLLVAAVAVAGIREIEPAGPAAPRSVLVAELGDAVSWVRHSPHVLALLGLAVAGGMFMGSRFVLYPALSRDVLDAGPTGLGFLTSAAGVGSLVGSMLTDRSGRALRRGRVLVVALSVAGVAYALIGAVPILGVALALAGLIACSLTIYQMTSSTIVQVLAPIEMRGRTLAMFDLVRAGLVPVGGLLGGFFAERLGTPLVLAALGGLTVATVLFVAAGRRDLVGLDIDGEGLATLRGIRVVAGPPRP